MLRQVISHLRRQDWAAVAIELVVVVAGVFIGVQASNWNEDRETNHKAAVFAERLRGDLREEAWNYEYYIGYYEEVLGSAKATADALTGTKPLPDEALLISAYRATQYHSGNRRRATYDELTSTGQIGLIRDRALRELAMTIYTADIFIDIVQEGKTSRFRTAFRGMIPYDVQQKLAEACGDRVVPVGDYAKIVHSLDYPCTTGLPKDVIARNAGALRNDSELVTMLRLRIADVATNLSNFTVFSEEIRDGLHSVAQQNP